MQDPALQVVSPSNLERYAVLDCLRGLAACTVVICHTIMLGLFRVEPAWSSVKWTPLRLLWSGHQAVILFFVLSGFSLFMLSTSLATSSARTVRFLLARWLRLYPVYAASLLLALAAYSLLPQWTNAHRDPLLYVPSPAIARDQLWLHLTLIGEFDTSLVNPPIWSIVYEMRLSLVFPLIVWLLKRMPYRTAMASLVGSLAAVLHGWTIPQAYGSHSLALSALNTLHYSTFFIAGALLAKYRLPLIAWCQRRASPVRVGGAIAALALYGYGYDETWTSGQIMLGDLAVGAGSAALILLSIAYPLLTRASALHFLGRISYSLYLVHFTCFGVVSVLFYGRLPNTVLWLMVIALSLVVASLTWLLIEQPALHWSRAIRPHRQAIPPSLSATSGRDELRPPM